MLYGELVGVWEREREERRLIIRTRHMSATALNMECTVLHTHTHTHTHTDKHI